MYKERPKKNKMRCKFYSKFFFFKSKIVQKNNKKKKNKPKPNKKKRRKSLRKETNQKKLERSPNFHCLNSGGKHCCHSTTSKAYGFHGHVLAAGLDDSLHSYMEVGNVHIHHGKMDVHFRYHWFVIVLFYPFL